uniref:putative GIY-YIG homing endonuclease n=1 Tax=Watanabea sichuanensis TaxID=2704660 RepID=UPI002410FBEA|nr:putative GIY-YIG homing endonuclease [Watanabea sichuanensis]WDY13123.1 putative GIY-YIG homing endonuclease [Watanabea sichuanensis]
MYVTLNTYFKFQAGLYEIHCLQNWKRYVGESGNILESDCAQLQHDWDLYTASHFDFRVRSVGRKWKNVLHRQTAEKEMIAFYVKQYGEMYNNVNSFKAMGSNYRKILNINGIEYSSIKQASKALNLVETTVRRRLKDFSLTTYSVTKVIPQGYSTVSINSVEYSSVKDLVHVGSAKDRDKGTRRFK